MEPPSPSWGDYEVALISCGDRANVGAVDLLVEKSYGNDEDNNIINNDIVNTVCINYILPDDILERVLGHLPIATIIKVSCVCKKWNELVHSQGFIQKVSRILAQKPWYFMFTCNGYPYGHAYDPILLKWYGFEIPYVESPSWNLVSSSGLVCFMDNDYRRKLYVCNPITKHCLKLAEPPGAEVSDYCALAISLNNSSLSYTVTIVKSKQAPGEPVDWDLSINVYSSDNKMWVSPVNVSLQAWRGGADSVICHGVLYFVVYLTRTLGYVRPRSGVVAYDLASQSFDIEVDKHVISAPCPVTCMRLMNLEEQLVLVGGIEKQGRPGIIKGIGIWILRGKDWEEVSRMPNKFFKGFGEFDDVFASMGFDRLIFIHSYGSPALLMFDLNLKEWKWSPKCPAPKKFPLQLFSGVCFEPRFDIIP